MKQRKECSPEDIVAFLLALCCREDSSTSPPSRDKDLDKRINACNEKIIQISKNVKLKEKLDKYGLSKWCSGERYMHLPFADAMNHALEQLSDVEVDGLPEFKSHIAFVPCDARVESIHCAPGASSKPNMVVMSAQDAYRLYGLNQTDAPVLSKFITKIKGQKPSGTINWNSVLSAVQVKRGPREEFSNAGEPSHQGGREVPVLDADQQLLVILDDFQPTTCSSLTTAVSSKWSASSAELDSGDNPSSKRPRVSNDTTQLLDDQNSIWATEKFSESFFISHVLNLFVAGDYLSISWVDREGVIFSSRFSFFENPPLLLVLLLVVQRFGRTQWGYIPELSAEDHSVLLHPVCAGGTLDDNKVAVNFCPEDEVHSAWSLLGRATTVVGANRNEGGDSEDTPRVQEEAYQAGCGLGDGHSPHVDTTQTNPPATALDKVDEEWRDFYEAQAKYRETLAKTIKSHNLVLKVSWPETSRLEEWKIIEHAQSLGKKDKFIKGHVPDAKYARDIDRYSTEHIRRFLYPQEDGRSRTRTLRLIVMNRLRPIYDLDGGEFWKAFWECVACHYRLWVNGIHHEDISPGNLMYDFMNGDPVGVVNDFDLANWVGHSTANKDRIGTIPFMAIDLLSGGLEERVPRLYRHDMESFSWILAYVTVAEIEYEGSTIKISPAQGVNIWFENGDEGGRDSHITQKFLFHMRYGRRHCVSARYIGYFNTIKGIIRYWSNFHASLVTGGSSVRPREAGMRLVREEPVVVGMEREADDPAGSLRSFIETLGEIDAGEGFMEVKAHLLEAIEAPKAVVV